MPTGLAKRSYRDEGGVKVGGISSGGRTRRVVDGGILGRGVDFRVEGGRVLLLGSWVLQVTGC